MTSKIKVKPLNYFNTVVANSNTAKGEIITEIRGELTESASKYSIQISETEHLLPFSSNPNDPVSTWRFLNHSCEPNSYIDLQKMVLIALTDIFEGEEVRFNYNTTEFEISSPFICNCKSINCYGKIKGFRHLSGEKQKILNPYIAPYLKKNTAQSIS